MHAEVRRRKEDAMREKNGMEEKKADTMTAAAYSNRTELPPQTNYGF